MKKTIILETIFLIFLMAGIILIGNWVGQDTPFLTSFIAMILIASIACLGYLISLLPLLKKLPSIIWISFIGIYLSSPFSPWQAEILNYIKTIGITSVSTPVLAFAGLAIGKDLALFKSLSWKIIPVALAVFSGTFIFAALLAHFTLQW